MANWTVTTSSGEIVDTYTNEAGATLKVISVLSAGNWTVTTSDGLFPNYTESNAQSVPRFDAGSYVNPADTSGNVTACTENSKTVDYQTVVYGDLDGQTTNTANQNYMDASENVSGFTDNGWTKTASETHIMDFLGDSATYVG